MDTELAFVMEHKWARLMMCVSMLVVVALVGVVALQEGMGVVRVTGVSDAEEWGMYHSLSLEWTPSVPGSLVFNQTFGGLGDEVCYAMIRCSDGGFALAGDTPNATTTGKAGFLVRTDAQGNLLWNKTYQEGDVCTIRDLVECSDGGFALAGANHTSSPWNTDVWLVRTDSAGNRVWSNSFGPLGVGPGNDVGKAIVLCNDGGFAIAGDKVLYGAMEDGYYLVRTDSNGNMLWNQTYWALDQASGEDLVQCSDNGFAIVGHNRFYDAGLEDQVVLIRTDSNGNYLWNQTYGGADDEQATALQLCADGGFAVGGVFHNRTSDIRDMLLLRIDASGNHLWNHTYGASDSDGFGGMVNCTDGGYALIGHSLNPSGPEWNIWLVRTDAMGNPQWTRIFGGSDSETGAAIVESGSDTFTVAGTLFYHALSSGDFWLFQTYDSPLEWVSAPSDYVVEFGTILQYDLDATSSVSLDKWWINDTIHFSISSQGVITNTSVLSVGTYGLQVWVNDTLGNELTATLLVTVEDTTPPSWVVAPTDQLLAHGTNLDVTFEATDLSGIDSWSVNDTTNFVINETGHLNNLIPLETGYYDLNISVFDPYGNRRSREIEITVLPPTSPPPPAIPGFPILAILIGLITSIGITFKIRRRRARAN